MITLPAIVRRTVALCGRVLHVRLRVAGSSHTQRHFVVSLSKMILAQPKKCPDLTEKLLTGT